MKNRNEHKLEDTWDLTLIYKDNAEFYKDLELVNTELKEIITFKGKILESSNSLYNFLELSDKLERHLYKLYFYVHLTLDQDTTNTLSQEMEGKVTNLLQEYEVMTSFVTPELLDTDYSIVKGYINENSNLKKYEFNLYNIYRYQEHKLNNDEEVIISNLSKVLDLSEDIFEALTDADIEFPSFIVNNVKYDLSESNYVKYLENKNQYIRKNAFHNLLTTYGSFKNTIAKTFSGNVETLTKMAKIKKFNSSLEASLFPDDIDINVYNNLINTINNHLDTLYKYYDLKKECLNLDELHLYDIYTPIVKEFDKEYSFEEGKDLVFKALKVLGDDYLNNLNKAFDERWIDKYTNKGKRTGAYSSGFYDTKPYLLLNYENRYDDVSTLIHELGHSMHTYYSCNNNTYNNSSYQIFVAEVASTVNELLLARYLLNNSNSDNEKLFILNRLMELYKGTIYRQVMFAEFERDMHKALENGEVLTNEYLCNNYYELVKKYFGPNVVIDDEIKNEWMRIPHFYYNFYVYKYAIGLSSATKIVNDILNNKENAVENYLSFLKTGGSMKPSDELLIAGVDVHKEDLYLDAIKDFNDYIDEFKKIQERINYGK